MKYRNRTEIATHILVAANDGITKTKLMYTAFLCFNQLKEYLAILEEKELLAHDETSMTYKTTAKGREYIDMVYKLSEISGLAIVDAIQETGLSRLPKGFSA